LRLGSKHDFGGFGLDASSLFDLRRSVATFLTGDSHDDNFREIRDGHHAHLADAVGPTPTADGRELHNFFLGVVVFLLLIEGL